VGVATRSRWRFSRVTFLLFGAIGAGQSAEWIPRCSALVFDVSGIEMHFGWLLLACYFGFFHLLMGIHLFWLREDQTGAGTGDHT